MPHQMDVAIQQYKSEIGAERSGSTCSILSRFHVRGIRLCFRVFDAAKEVVKKGGPAKMSSAIAPVARALHMSLRIVHAEKAPDGCFLTASRFDKVITILSYYAW